ncbi:predicted protein [Nematostella vectensis]|uniref:Acyl-CoA synthetase n=2 Tax=Nematostella vectensis TaxID=45351 RepID=A7SBP2_NEMVE|nr:predicted protein [Nematostella vectensis]|eukprot:XP_001630969.1 predicted protein [Nematostella vectensis]
MSYVHRPHTTPLECRTLFQLLDEQAALRPDKEAIVYRDETGYNHRKSITFKQYQEQSQCLAIMLLELGLGRGDEVLLMLETSIEFIVFHMALNRIGAVALIVGPHYDDAVTELSGQISAVAFSSQQSDVTSAVSAIVGDIKAAIFVGPDDGVSTSCHSYETLLRSGKEKPRDVLIKAENEVQFDDLTVFIFTSGSTGIPKPCEYTHHGFVNAIIHETFACGYTSDTVIFSYAPFDWITGSCIFTLSALLGLTYVIFPPRLSLDSHMIGAMLGVFEEEKVTNAIVLPPFFLDLYELEGVDRYDLRKLVQLETGGQMMDKKTVKKAISKLPHTKVLVVYAATEFCTAGRTICTRDNIDSAEFGLYEIIPGFEVKIVDPEGKLVMVDTKGELCVREAGMLLRSDFMIKGHRHEAKSPTGWYFTHDRASLTSDGRLRIHGRQDNLIKCATESIQPAEVELPLHVHECIQQVIAVGVPDQRLYEVVCACVVLNPRFRADSESAIAQINQWACEELRANTAGIDLTRPRYYLVFDEFPKTRTGKDDRKEIKRMAAERLGLSRDGFQQ